jgi:hypothetical protein
LLVGGLVAPAHAESIDPQVGAEPITLTLDVRLRYTSIEQSNRVKKVDVTTVRVAPGLEAKLSPQLKLSLELIHTDFIGPKRFADNPAVPSPYPLLPDPRYSGLNQTMLTWIPSENIQIAAGRQAVKIGNERHVSDDNFRQIPQLFDGALVQWNPFDNAALKAGYFPKMRSIFGPVQQAKLGVFEFAFNPVNDVSTTTYVFRHQPAASAGNIFSYGVANYSNVTYGATVDASFAVGAIRTTLTGEAARQRSLAGGSALVAANYYRVGVGATLNGWTLRADHENRGSNNGRYGFQTVLSDYYAYNGNSLVFFATPTNGLRDTWATLRWERGRWSMLHEYHWFRSDVDGKNYGRELDLNFTYKWTEHWYARAQWAHYRPDARPAADVDKVWITLGYLLP